MTDAYDEEFFFTCEFLAERLGLSVRLVQANVAVLGLRMVRGILDDVNVKIRVFPERIDWKTSIPFELDIEDDWSQYRIETAWKMVTQIARKIRERGEVPT